eukprot:96952_1
MISTVKDYRSNVLYEFIEKNQQDIKAIYKSIEITMDKALKWIKVRMPEHRYHPFQMFMHNNFPKSVKIRYTKIPFCEHSNERPKINRLQMFNTDAKAIIKTYNFINKFNYCTNTP